MGIRPYNRWKTIWRLMNLGAALAAPLFFTLLAPTWGANKAVGVRTPSQAASKPPVQLTRERAARESTQSLLLRVELSPPRAFFEWKAGALALQEPRPEETHFLKVIAHEKETGRWVPFTRVEVALYALDSMDVVLTTKALDLVWDKHDTYYGKNISLPDELTHKNVSATIRLVPTDAVVRTVDAVDSLPLGALSMEISPSEIALVPKDITTTGAKLRGRLFDLEGRHPPVEPTPYPGSKSRHKP